MSQLSASPMRIADSTALALTTGIAPGRPRQVGQTWELGSPPKTAGQPQNILVLVLSSTWTSRPSAGSYDASTSSKATRVSVMRLLRPEQGPCRPAGNPTARAGGHRVR